jgi:membrane protein
VIDRQSHGRYNNRGRDAEGPTEIPKAGWKDIFVRVKDKMSKHNLSIIAAGVAFHGFLAIFPGLAAFVSVYGLLTSPSELQNHVKFLEGVLPLQTAGLIQDLLQGLVTTQPRQLGWGLAGSLILGLWSTSKAMKALIEAINVTYEEEERRGTLKLNLTAIALTLGAILLGIAFVTLIAGVPVLLEVLSLGPTTAALVNYMRWPLLFIAGIFPLAVLYRYGPCRNRAEWKWVSVGAVIAVSLWLVGSLLFSVYVSNFNSYDKTYGSLGVIVVFMMWFFLSSYSILLGSEINAEMERQTARDTTSGPPKPRGNRGAQVADTVGQSIHR